MRVRPAAVPPAPILGCVDVWLLAVVWLGIGLVVGWTASRLAARRADERLSAATPGPEQPPLIPEALELLLAVLPQSSLVLDPSGRVLRSALEPQALGIVADDGIANADVAALVRESARTREVLERDIDLGRLAPGRAAHELRVRVAPVSDSLTVVLVEDLAEARRVEAVRRDFVVNVSHELKTPVGALALLAEAIESASDDPDQVLRFARRMRVESSRLAAIIADIVELSRIQGDNPLEHADMVLVDAVIAESVDSMQTVADAKGIQVVRGGTEGLCVIGEQAHLIAALRNLIGNAINYSPEGTRVAVASRMADGMVEVSVTDQGIGIPPADQERIFERFYRVDPARSRETGGTGLGLAIVKHVCATHGGEVTVWSRPGEGSTFTIRIPQAAGHAAAMEAAS